MNPKCQGVQAEAASWRRGLRVLVLMSHHLRSCTTAATSYHLDSWLVATMVQDLICSLNGICTMW